MTRLFILLAFVCLIRPLAAQEITFTSYDLSETIDDPTLQEFAAFPDGTAYMYYRYFASGQRDVAMVYFDGAEWSPIDTLCTTCVRHIAAGPDNKLYVAAGSDGIYRRDAGAWTQLVTDVANDIAFAPDGTLHFVNTDGIFTYDGTTVSPGSVANLPSLNANIRDMRFRADGRLYVLNPPNLYSYDGDEGFTQQSEVTSPLFIAPHPDGKMYVADAFGQIGYFEGDDFVNNAITGVFPSGIPLAGFDISDQGIFWGSRTGFSSGVIRYDGSTASGLVPAEELINDAIIVSPIHAGFNGRLYVAADLRPGIAIINDGTSAVSNLSAGLEQLLISPNPAGQYITVDARLTQGGSGAVRLLDVTGRALRNWPVEFVTGNFSRRFQLEGLAPGTYWLELRSGNMRGVTRLVVGQ